MPEDIDGGPILVPRSIPVGDSESSTADGTVLAHDRMLGLPVGLFRLARPLYRL